jgi:hypothetical protein
MIYIPRSPLMFHPFGDAHVDKPSQRVVAHNTSPAQVHIRPWLFHVTHIRLVVDPSVQSPQISLGLFGSELHPQHESLGAV